MKSIAIAIFFLLLIYSHAIAYVGQPQLPGDVTIDKKTGYGEHLSVTVRLADGEELPLDVDTGSPITILDESLKSQLGKRLGTVKTMDWGTKEKCGIYAAPKLYLGNTLLMTGSQVLTCNFKKLLPKNGPMGILGMDCLEHYCIQLDFAAGKMRFLDPAQMDASRLGDAFPMVFSSIGQGNTNFFRTYIRHAGLIGDQGDSLLIDTGLDIDGALAPEIIEEQEMQLKGNGIKRLDKTTWYFRGCVWDGQTYTNLMVNEAKSFVAGKEANVMGLRFLARHLVTLDFPDRMMYLQQQSVGPLPDDNFVEDDEQVNSLNIAGDKLPVDIEARLNAVLDKQSLPMRFKWFGGTITIKKPGDTISYHYTVHKSHGLWKLERAWSTDPYGNTIKAYVVP
jgi:hypothetical protein